MKQSVRDYYRWPMPAPFVSHMIQRTGITKEQREIVEYLRSPESPADCSNEDAAAHFHMRRKRFDDIFASMSYAMMRELFRLALNGFYLERGWLSPDGSISTKIQ